ncbi:serine hydroxymethyltransferase 2 [Sphaeroforma arctica JP610]|uniref:Serine hydroxymethyltransferase n=1 Tax=Sphaeroforma arctica JP610 TaxID=667725 RepID=A0A0L0GA62_9EUKA|nr:serine hydroxymethyltransferase 2 [Sphaeroforma arctica JP610]KNC85799.1 serine hydroxymethyltransferase 2 [Sphaeroforma arctica JP610]|eukprot:XP_014159701.1 serine hydroxymethyltransferase 2 [Sphaeroforma arctica JP610]
MTMDAMLSRPLKEEDPEIYDLIEKEKNRQWRGLELIASENFTSAAVMEANGSCLTNKYSEGLPGARYYGGNEHIDVLETLCQRRALEAFRLSADDWSCNVQPYSGSTANFAALLAMMKPNDRLMGLDLPSGGHLTHGYQTAKKKISSTSIFWQSMPYQVDPETGYVDYDRLEDHASVFRPNVLIMGGSAYPRDWDYKRMRAIADKHGAYLMMDMAHISGLIAAEVQGNAFDYCDVVTTTTHKTLRGPRAGIIFFRKAQSGERLADLESRVNFAVFPSTQGGPHNNTIAGIAVAMKQACTPEFKQYAKQVIANMQACAARLSELGYTLVTGGTDNHCCLWDVRPQGLTGSKLEKLFELISVTINKNSVPKDTSALSPGGVRLGACALTSRGFLESDFVEVADLLHEAVQATLELQKQTGKKLKDFEAGLANYSPSLQELKNKAEALATRFPMPGYDCKDMTYNTL